ncbi:lycopene beta-cyclase CrtY [Parvularcula sp. LCG005]|uniref:lycopene beta-cyclase CrtY n=1 Tax=Parvularcula sp. LCG005 TaxID=3078805 RepID=UPI0029424065|nr:lycopene beta-cyclase CrtY [Parvularcula sp. LCG005]WOI54582.1 lycopene beta-cyclase CrtY [Parvularcula sp. LCG005]
MNAAPTFDVIIAGGGLSGGLTAYRLLKAQPDLRILLLERDAALGGNHTWSFHETDLTADELSWIEPFVSYSWPAQKVAFPARQREIAVGYRSITSEHFAQILTERLPTLTIRTRANVSDLTAEAATIRTGRGEETFNAPLVFDARGPIPSPHMALAFQKFLGLELSFSSPHGETIPTIMDATVPQTDGYRFVYVLPLTARSAIIEDTYYADGADLPTATLKEEIFRYAAARGWTVEEIAREERGILPIVLDGDINAYWSAFEGGPAPLGLRAGLFHPVTGYSVPDAVRLADLIAASSPRMTAAASEMIRHYAQRQWQTHRFYRMLNRMLFRAARPQERYIVLQRFYGLPQPLISRFYAGRNTWQDQIRILAGKPPVPISRAIRHLAATGRGDQIEEGQLG